MVTNFNSKDLTSFGKYLLSEKRTNRIKESHKEGDSISLEEKLREVYQADMQNWKEDISKSPSDLLSEFLCVYPNVDGYISVNKVSLQNEFSNWIKNK